MGVGTKLEDGIYKYYINTLSASEGFSLYSAWGNKINNINIFANLFGFAGTTIDTVKTIIDENSKWYDSLSQYIKLFGTGVNTIGTAYIADNFSEMIITTTGTNQIIAVPKLAAENATGLKNASAALTLIDVGFSATSAGIKKYGQVSEDGTTDMGDWGEVGVAFACNGLAKLPVLNIISGLTEAATGVTVDDFADKLIEGAGNIGVGIGNITNEWLEKHQAMNYIVRNSDTDSFANTAATTVSMILATKDYLGEKVVSGADAVASWFSGLKAYFAK